MVCRDLGPDAMPLLLQRNDLDVGIRVYWMYAIQPKLFYALHRSFFGLKIGFVNGNGYSKTFPAPLVCSSCYLKQSVIALIVIDNG